MHGTARAYRLRQGVVARQLPKIPVAHEIDPAVAHVPHGRGAPAVGHEHRHGRPHLPVSGGLGYRPYLVVGAMDCLVHETHPVGESDASAKRGADAAAHDGARLSAGIPASHAVGDAEHERPGVGYDAILVVLPHGTAFACDGDINPGSALSANESEQHGGYPLPAVPKNDTMPPPPEPSSSAM